MEVQNERGEMELKCVSEFFKNFKIADENSLKHFFFANF